MNLLRKISTIYCILGILFKLYLMMNFAGMKKGAEAINGKPLKEEVLAISTKIIVGIITALACLDLLTIYSINV